MPKLKTWKQIMALKFNILEGIPPRFAASFGELCAPFMAIIWGQSGNGKTNMLMQFMEMLTDHGRVLYVSLEEGYGKSIQLTLARHFDGKEAAAANIVLADHSMRFDALCERLRKRKSPRFIIIDSLQYWDITIDQYKALKEEFRTKCFLFISHAKGKEADGRVASKVRYDSDIKVRVEGYVAFVQSRFQGNAPFIIWEDGAKRYWGKKFRSITKGAYVTPKPQPSNQQSTQ